MFAIKIYSMFIRNDGFCTGNKASIKLFPSVLDAKEYIEDWKTTTTVDCGDNPLEIVEVETKPIATKIGRVVGTVDLAKCNSAY